MKFLLNINNNIVKEVKKMKLRYLGILVVALMLALVLKTNALAVDPITTQTNYVISTYLFNLFGVGIGGTQKSSTTTTTTLSGVEQSKSTQTNTTNLSYLGGSLKADNVAVSGSSTNKDGSTSSTSGTIDYVYDASGRLSSASGDITTNQNSGTDALGQQIGTATYITKDTYVIKNGQSVQAGSVTDGTAKGPDGKVVSLSKETVTLENALLDGEWVVMKETTHSQNSGGTAYSDLANGNNWSDTTTIRTYARDSVGKITSINQTMTGTQNIYTPSTNGNQKQAVIQTGEGAYKATFTFDSKRGYVLTNLVSGWQNIN